MRMVAGGFSLALALLLGCLPAPSEVVGASQGQGSSSGEGPSDGPPISGGDGPGSTGPVADGAASSSSGTPELTSSEGGPTGPVDPDTTGTPGTTTDDPESTGPAATSVEPGSSSDGGDQSCFDIYGMAPGYFLCTEEPESCRFNVSLGVGNDCNGICNTYGGHTCMGAQDNPQMAGQECLVQGESTCEWAQKSTTICICSK